MFDSISLSLKFIVSFTLNIIPFTIKIIAPMPLLFKLQKSFKIQYMHELKLAKNELETNS